jgi:hypothetical protein
MPSGRGNTGESVRKPAQYGREVVLRHTARAVIALALLCGVPALLVLALDVRSLLLVPLELVAIAVMLVVDRRVGRDIDRRIRGIRGEEQVGAVLTAMSAEGWRTLHDSVLDRGNVDHIVVGPGGLFTVETKSHRGRFDVERLNESWLKQAYAQRKVLERAVDHRAKCLLVFSCAYLSQGESQQRGVVVLPARLLAGYLRRQRAVYSSEQVTAIYEELKAALELAVAR